MKSSINIWKYWLKFSAVLFFYSWMPFLGGCQSSPKPSDALSAVFSVYGEDSQNWQKPLELKASGELQHRYALQSKIREYLGDQMTRDRKERTDFVVKTVGSSPNKGEVWNQVSVIFKEGPQDLREMGLPELNEQMLFQFSSRGEVLHVQGQPKGSFYYVPPIPLPTNETVGVGDTWVRQFQWMSRQAGIPLEMEVVGILKNFVECGEQSPCAHIEFSGAVGVLGQPQVVARFESEFQGDLLFSLPLGDVLWSLTKGRERMILPEQSSDIESCTRAELQQPELRDFDLKRLPGC